MKVSGLGDVAQLVWCSPSKLKALVPTFSINTSLRPQACSLSTWETEGSEIQDPLHFQSKSEGKPSLRNKTEENDEARSGPN